MTRTGNALGKIVILFFGLILSGCVGCPAQYKNPNDPFESYNRAAFAFNMSLDKFFFRPSARVYAQVTPKPIRRGVSNIYDNLDLIPTVANDILQLRLHRTFADGWRLFINTTVGVVGLFDVATNLGLPKQQNDFGLTLARWGYRHSTYLVIPIIGPATTRDAVGYFADLGVLSIWPYIHPMALSYGIFSVGKVNSRANLLSYDKLLYESFDPYIFMRDAYLQQRNNQINQMNGQPKNVKDTSNNAVVDADVDAGLSADAHDSQTIVKKKLNE